MESQTLGKEAFSALVEQHQAAFYRTARSILRNEQDVADAVHHLPAAAECGGSGGGAGISGRARAGPDGTADALGGGLKAAGADADYREPVLL